MGRKESNQTNKQVTGEGSDESVHMCKLTRAVSAYLLEYETTVSWEGSDKSVHMCKLIRAVSAYPHKIQDIDEQ